MKRIKTIRILLDIVLTLGLLTLYSKNLFGMKYHEVAGLLLLGAICVHIFINLKIVTGMVKNFQRVPLYIKVCLVVDILLFLLFVMIGISGILISKTILTGISTSNNMWKMLHMCLGALSVIFLGIHIGLHICRKEWKTGMAVLVTVLVFAAGIYGLCTTGITHYLSMPFTVMSGAPSMENGHSMGNGPEHDGRGADAKAREDGTQHQPGENSMGTHDSDSETEEASPDAVSSATQQTEETAAEQLHAGENFAEQMPSEAESAKQMPSEAGSAKQMPSGMGRQTMSMSWAGRIQILIAYFGMMFSCSMFTYWLVIAKKHLR